MDGQYIATTDNCQAKPVPATGRLLKYYLSLVFKFLDQSLSWHSHKNPLSLKVNGLFIVFRGSYPMLFIEHDI